MKHFRNLLLSTIGVASFISNPSAATAEADLKEDSSQRSSLRLTQIAANLSETELTFPVCLLKASDDSWRLMIHSPSKRENPPVVSFEDVEEREEGDTRRLTQKFFHEIPAMCNLMQDKAWELEAFYAPFFWGNSIVWSIPRGIVVKFSKLVQMGFEVESSVIKIRPGKGNETYMMDVFRSGQGTWAFTSDTTDQSLQSGDVAWMNTECKTLGGLNFHQTGTALDEVNDTWKTLLQLCNDDTSDTVLCAQNISFEIQWENDGGKRAAVWAPFSTEAQNERRAYPQITYSLPLKLLPGVFERLCTLSPEQPYSKRPDWFRFAKGLLPELNEQFKDKSDAELEREKLITQGVIPLVRINTELNKRMQQKILTAFSAMMQTDTQHSAATGIAYMCFFYTYQLFSNGLYLKETEPGPKPLFSVMSRVPFSTMYRNLSDREKDKFRLLVETYLKPFFNNKLRKYKTKLTDDSNEYIDLTDEQLITLGEWYNSIITPPEGQEDLLSPPPGCEGGRPAYGMGAYNGETVPDEYALVEVRGYSRLRPKGCQITIDNVTEFIENEARWFFTFQPTEY